MDFQVITHILNSFFACYATCANLLCLFSMNKLTALCLTMLLSAICWAQHPLTASTDPDKVQIVTSDIPRFWTAFDSVANAPKRSVELYDRLYFKDATYGLGIFKEAAIGSSEEFAAKIDKYRLYYQSIRKNTLSIDSKIPEMRRSLRKLKKLYPQTLFPDVYIVMGSMGSGGRSMNEGLFLGAEVNCADENSNFTNISPSFSKVLKSLTLSGMPSLVVHELVHYQQKYTDTSKNVLSRAIVEGSADFICKLATGATANELLHKYGDRHERELWTQFSRDLYSQDIQKWFYYPATETRPADLGYYIGFKITEAYYQKAKDKKKAISEILNIADFRSFLEKSGYGSQY